MAWGKNQQHHDQPASADQNQVSGKVRKPGRGLDADMVDHRVKARDHHHEDELVAKSIRNPQRWPKRSNHKRVRADVDCGEHRDQAQQVHPGGEPAPEPAAQN